MKNQKNFFPYGYGKELSEAEAAENFKEFRPILLRYALSFGLTFVVNYLTSKPVFLSPKPSALVDLKQCVPAPAPKVVRAPVGEAFGIAAVGFICASAAAGGNPISITLAVMGCAVAAAAQYFKK